MHSNRARAMKGTAAALAIMILAAAAQATRVKDLGSVYGPMVNPLEGYGLVVGLAGTGDDAKYATAIRILSNTLTNLGVSTSPLEVQGTKNVAMVSVSATLPAYNRVGDQLDVQVAAVGNAKSIKGGRLIVCPLGVPNICEMIAIASGTVKIVDETPTTGVIEGGAIVQKAVPVELLPGGKLTFKLLPQNADFSIATRIVEAIHQDANIDTAAGQPAIARAVDAGTIEVELTPRQLDNPVPFIARIEQLSVPGVAYDMEARVVIDEKKGAFYAINGNVEVAPVKVGYGSIEIEIAATPASTGTTLSALVDALRTANATPADVNGILKALSAVGALHAKVVPQ